MTPPRTLLSAWLLMAALILLPSTSSDAVTDPEMEPLTAILDSRLSLIRDWWEGEIGPDQVKALLAVDLSIDVPWPRELRSKDLPGQLQAAVWERPATPQRSTGVEASLKSLAFPHPQAASRTEMKVISVQEDQKSGAVSSEILVGAFLYDQASRREIRSKWRCDWIRPADRYLLAGLELVSYSELSLGVPAPPLVDRTTAILPAKAGEQEDEDLTRGNYYWRHRIEAPLDPDPFGHNGVSVADLNGDGRQDLYLCHFGGLSNRVFLQAPDGTLLDHGQASGLDFRDNTTAALFADFDNDGDQDAAIALSGALLFCRNNGQGVFSIEARHEEITHGYSMAAADYDLDGDLDLYICQYHGAPQGDQHPQRGAIPVPYPIFDADNGGRNVLFRNDGQLRFTDATAESGLDTNNRRFSFACLWEDWNQDGHPDLVVINDFGRITSYRNLKGSFREDSQERGFDQSGFGMGCVAADFNQDGWLDLYACNMFSGAGSRITREPAFRSDRGEQRREDFQQMAAGNTLFLSEEGQTFRECGQAAGVEMGRWSWGAASPDLNNDSWPDLLVANGFVTGTELDDL